MLKKGCVRSLAGADWATARSSDRMEAVVDKHSRGLLSRGTAGCAWRPWQADLWPCEQSGALLLCLPLPGGEPGWAGWSVREPICQRVWLSQAQAPDRCMLLRMCRSPPSAIRSDHQPVRGGRQAARGSGSASWPSTFNQALDQLTVPGADGAAPVPNPMLRSHPQPFVQAYHALCQVCAGLVAGLGLHSQSAVLAL